MRPYQAVIEGFCQSNNLPAPVTEFKFHPRRKWRFDFAWVKQKLGLEVDGGVYARGGHTRGKGYEDDREKDGEATCLGWRVLRLSTGQLERGLLWPWLEKLLRAG